MELSPLDTFLKSARRTLARGPVALIFVEDEVEVEATLRHHLGCGFRRVVAFVGTHVSLSPALAEAVAAVEWDRAAKSAHDILNACIAAAPGTWFYYGYNAEFLFHPFSETRNVAEMVAFAAEERRDTVLITVVDLYASDLSAHPGAVALRDAWMDRLGYYALARTDAWNNPLDRQMDFYGGLRWRMEEHIPKDKRRIDRVALFKAKPGLVISEDHIASDPEYNTYACPWHHSITAAICSFRTAKALRRNPGSRDDIATFRWHGSVKFEWKSQQLMDLGLMEPGQWF